LSYGPREGSASGGPERHDGARDLVELLVLPRTGTISPWSSKATDIARNCGLAKLRRVERGIRYRISGVPPAQVPTLAAMLHDRMTQSVLHKESDAVQLFQVAEPRALQ